MKFKYSFILFLVIAFLFPVEILNDLPSDSYDWKVLKEGRVTVWNSSKDMGIPWCRARAVYPFSVEAIYSALKDLSNYKNIFERVTESNILDKDIVYIRLVMPRFLADRDYTGKYMDTSET